MRSGTRAWPAAALVLIAGLTDLSTAQGPASDFRPDSVFSGSTLNGWHVLGQARWKAQGGEIVGTAAPSGGGWLVLDKSYQDLNFFTHFRCASASGASTPAPSPAAGDCQTGVLLRLEKTANGMTACTSHSRRATSPRTD